MRCEDYPCCGHGPAPLGDGGGCPDEEGRFRCLGCGERMPAGASSSFCGECREGGIHDPEDPDCLCRRCVVAAADELEADEEPLPCGHAARFDLGDGYCERCAQLDALEAGE